MFWAAGAASIAAALMTRSLPLKRGQVQSERRPILASALEGIAALKQSEGTGRMTFIFGAQFLVLGALDILTVVLGLELLSLDQSGPGTLASALGDRWPHRCRRDRRSGQPAPGWRRPWPVA